MVVNPVQQTWLDSVRCEKLVTACFVMASVVNYLYLAVTASVEHSKYIQSILYFVSKYKKICI